MFKVSSNPEVKQIRFGIIRLQKTEDRLLRRDCFSLYSVAVNTVDSRNFEVLLSIFLIIGR